MANLETPPSKQAAKAKTKSAKVWERATSQFSDINTKFADNALQARGIDVKKWRSAEHSLRKEVSELLSNTHVLDRTDIAQIHKRHDKILSSRRGKVTMTPWTFQRRPNGLDPLEEFVDFGPNFDRIIPPIELGGGTTVLPVFSCVYDQYTADGTIRTSSQHAPVAWVPDAELVNAVDNIEVDFNLAGIGGGVGTFPSISATAVKEYAVTAIGEATYCFKPEISVIGELVGFVPDDGQSSMIVNIVADVTIASVGRNTYAETLLFQHVRNPTNPGVDIFPISYTPELEAQITASPGETIYVSARVIAWLNVQGLAGARLDLTTDDRGVRFPGLHWGTVQRTGSRVIETEPWAVIGLTKREPIGPAPWPYT